MVSWDSKEQYNYNIRNELNKIHNEIVIFVKNK
jgi:hypothetical protein